MFSLMKKQGSPIHKCIPFLFVVVVEESVRIKFFEFLRRRGYSEGCQYILAGLNVTKKTCFGDV